MHFFIETTQISQLEEVRAQNKYQKQMLANVSHEFRTPINAMHLSLLMLKDSTTKKNQKFVRIASSSCTLLSSLVEDILDHAKLEVGMFEIHKEQFYPIELLDEIKEIFELQLSSMNIKLEFELEDVLKKTMIMADKKRLKQVMMNLLSNSLKFTTEGYVKVKLEVLRYEKEELCKPGDKSEILKSPESCNFNTSERIGCKNLKTFQLSSQYLFSHNKNDLKSLLSSNIPSKVEPRNSTN
mmetsp:Transcript_2413/g.2085  ORF Transcript_2413/g.2085 Transcript_2413/m.2085 type:complete len:240 (+) Transcript_2413:724-1443(+)